MLWEGRSESVPRVIFLSSAGSYATESRQPRQVRKEATVTGHSGRSRPPGALKRSARELLPTNPEQHCHFAVARGHPSAWSARIKGPAMSSAELPTSTASVASAVGTVASADHDRRPKVPRVGVFGWGIVAPKSPNIEAFARNLEKSESWLTPFDGFGAQLAPMATS